MVRDQNPEGSSRVVWQHSISLQFGLQEQQQGCAVQAQPWWHSQGLQALPGAACSLLPQAQALPVFTWPVDPLESDVTGFSTVPVAAAASCQLIDGLCH